MHAATAWTPDRIITGAAAVQVTEEGGTDALIEAPAIYAALDSLGQRVAAWTERQHRAGQPLGADLADGVLSPEEAAACAARAIKQVPAVHWSAAGWACFDRCLVGSTRCRAAAFVEQLGLCSASQMAHAARLLSSLLCGCSL